MLTNMIHCVTTCRYPENAWEVMFGYDQEAFLGVRAGTAVVAALRAAEQLATKQQS